MVTAQEFAERALALEGVQEVPHFERRAFRCDLIFASLAPDGLSANLKLSPEEQQLKCIVAPEIFTPLANAWGQKGWTRVELSGLGAEELAQVLVMACAHGRKGKHREGKQRKG